MDFLFVKGRVVIPLLSQKEREKKFNSLETAHKGPWSHPNLLECKYVFSMTWIYVSIIYLKLAVITQRWLQILGFTPFDMEIPKEVVLQFCHCLGA